MPESAKARKPTKAALKKAFKIVEEAIETIEMEYDLAKSAMVSIRNKIRGLKARTKEMKVAKETLKSIEVELSTIERKMRDQKLERRDINIALGKGSTIKTNEVEL